MGRPFITFQQDGHDLQLILETGTYVEESTWLFSFDTTQQATAALMVTHLTNLLCAMMHHARQKAYDEGYRAGRNHETKRQGSSGHLWIGEC